MLTYHHIRYATATRFSEPQIATFEEPLGIDFGVVACLFIPILNSANIDLMLCGHIHEYRFSEVGDAICGSNFPIVCNPNRARMDVEVGTDKIVYKITNANAEEITNEISIK